MTTPNIEIRPMETIDLKNVVELGMATEELQIETNKPMYYSVENIKKLIGSGSGVCLTATVDGVFAGFFIATYHDYFNEGYLSDISVKTEYRKLGIGKKLFNTGMEELKKLGMEWSWGLVHEDNENMQKIMERQGFKKGRKFIFYYKDNDK